MTLKLVRGTAQYKSFETFIGFPDEAGHRKSSVIVEPGDQLDLIDLKLINNIPWMKFIRYNTEGLPATLTAPRKRNDIVTREEETILGIQMKHNDHYLLPSGLVDEVVRIFYSARILNEPSNSATEMHVLPIGTLFAVKSWKDGKFPEKTDAGKDGFGQVWYDSPVTGQPTLGWVDFKAAGPKIAEGTILDSVILFYGTWNDVGKDDGTTPPEPPNPPEPPTPPVVTSGFEERVVRSLYAFVKRYAELLGITL